MSTYQKALRDFVADEANTQAALAHQIGRSQAAVNRYAQGLRFPDSMTARKIDAATDGKVPFALWMAEASARIGIDARPTAKTGVAA